MNFTAENIFTMNEGIVFRTNKDGTVVVMKMNDDEVFYKIDGVAAEMFQKISTNEMTLGKIVEDLANEYSVPTSKIMEDAQPFLSRATSLELVSVR